MASLDAVFALQKFGNIRRQLNLVAVQLLKDLSLHPKQMVMLRFVHAQKQVSLTQLANGTATDMAAASRAIGPLIKQGWLKKVRNAEDSRCWIIQLTPKALRKMSEVEKIYGRLADLLCESLNARECKDFARTLDKVSKQLTETLRD